MSETALPDLLTGNIELPQPRILHKSLQRERARQHQEIKLGTVNKEVVDRRILDFEHKLFEVYREFTKQYKERFFAPTCVYVDQSIIDQGDEHGTNDKNDVSASYDWTTHSITIPVNIFTDHDFSTLASCMFLRHEFSHAASYRRGKITKFSATDDEKIKYKIDRGGATINADSGLRYGWLIDEGLHALEDEQFLGYGSDIFITSDDPAKKFSSLLAEKKADLTWSVVGGGSGGEVLRGTDLKGRFINLKYFPLSQFLRDLFKKDQSLFPLTREFVYGGKILSLSRKIDSIWGNGMFRKLMMVDSFLEVEKIREVLRD